MSDAQEAKNARRARERALATSAGANGLWNPEDIKARVDSGVEVPVGARLQFTSLRDLLDMGIGGGGSPVESMGIEQYLAANNMTPQQFQEQYGGLPYVFNNDGTVTYDPSAQRTAFEYTPASYARNQMIGLGLIGAIGGAGLMGLGQGAGVAGATGGGATSGIGNAIASGMIEGVGGAGVGAAGATAGQAVGAAGLGAAGGGIMQNLAQAATGTGNLSQAELAALVESGTTGPAGAALETAAGLNTAGLGDIAATGLANTTGIGGSVVNGASNLLGGSGTAATGGSALGNLLGLSPSASDLVGKLLGTGLGIYASNQQADAAQNLASQYMNMGAPYRAELANLNANPSSFYSSPVFQGALQQGSDSMARSLSAKVGNPILNPTALQEMQNYTTRGSLDAYNNRWNQLASAGQLGTSPAAGLGQAANQAQGQTYNAVGAGLQSVFGNQRDYTSELLDILKNRPATGVNSLY